MPEESHIRGKKLSVATEEDLNAGLAEVNQSIHKLESRLDEMDILANLADCNNRVYALENCTMVSPGEVSDLRLRVHELERQVACLEYDSYGGKQPPADVPNAYTAYAAVERLCSDPGRRAPLSSGHIWAADILRAFIEAHDE